MGYQESRPVYFLADPRTDSGSYYFYGTTNDDETRLANHRIEQVIAPYLIILRIANRRAFACDNADSGNVGSIHFKSRGKTTSGGMRPGEYPMNSMNGSEFGVGIEMTIDLHRGRVSGSEGSLGP